MAEKLRVGILTFHKCINYGSYWQARCLAEGLRRLGYDAELIDHHCPDVLRSEWRNALQPTLPQRSSRGEIRLYKEKVRKFQRAIADLPLSAQVCLHQPKSIDDYDVVLVGSDEVWNLAHPWYGNASVFYGNQVPALRLISYAASFGSYSCHWGLDEGRTRQLSLFDRLSVRDENSYWLVRGTTGREAPLVLDPCLQFGDAVGVVKRLESRPYAVVYGHGFPDWLVDAIEGWSSRTGVRLVSVGYRNDFAHEQALSSGPLEFAEFMSGAQSVITNFFHGCAFALLNSKPFVTAPSNYRHNKIQDLIKSTGASQRLVTEATSSQQYMELLSSPPSRQTIQRLGELRANSEEFLREALA